ncbi:MAG: hypothetical protein H0W01_01835 [Pseudonocardiales bacterium]|nr:hypothetical protein [Pseudonocardiales bacterium]
MLSVLIGLVVAIGAVVQGVVGFGMALIATPLLALLDPALVPVPLLLLSSVHSVLTLGREHRQADWHADGARLRATMGAYFVICSILSIVGLATAGAVTTEAMQAAAVLLPFMLAGFLLSGPVRRVLDAGWIRPTVLAVSGVSAVALLVKALI